MASGPIVAYVTGFRFVFKGMAATFSDKKLLKLAIIPFAIDLILFFTALWWGGALTNEWTQQAVGYFFSDTESFWYSLFYYPLLALFFVAFIVLATYMIYLVGSIIAAPFNSLLAEASLAKGGALKSESFNFNRWLRTTIRMLIASTIKAVFLGILGIIIFVLSFIPVVNVLAAFFAFLILAFDISDYSLELLEFNFNERVKYFKKNFFFYAGMATLLSFTVLIPGLTFLVLPFAVVGGAHIIALNPK